MKTTSLHIKTPLIESAPLSRKVKGSVWLKVEALQPTGSFKLRGVGHACRRYASEGAKRFISSSGGNAGIAVAYAGKKLGVAVTVVIPHSTPQRSIELIRQEPANVVVHGRTWQESHEYAVSLLDDQARYLHPFDDPLLWEGHATIMDEVIAAGLVPDAIVLSVGGGGLLCGVLEGLRRNNMAGTPVWAIETEGADSLAKSLKAGRPVELDDIRSLATSLGAKKIAQTAYDWSRTAGVVSHVVSDRAAVDACLQFTADHRLLVEPACGASLAAVYEPVADLSSKQNILVIICGGAGVTIQQLQAWDRQLDQKRPSSVQK
ncbi:MAG: pyridoxal-phosphate dependent enzyme [Desulfobacteraceae bacterium]|jgi:L-serine/L-threonine ammonia-lyase